MQAIRFSLLAVLVLAVSGMLSNDVSAEGEMHFKLTADIDLEDRELSEAYGDESIEEQPPSAYTQFSNSARSREWTEIGTWNSEDLDADFSFTGIEFNMWWVEDDEDENYNARMQMRWTLSADGNEIAHYQDTGDDEYTCERDRWDPCEWVGFMEISETFVAGQSLSVKIEYQSFQDIFIFYNDMRDDSGILFEGSEGGIECVTEPHFYGIAFYSIDGPDWDTHLRDRLAIDFDVDVSCDAVIGVDVIAEIYYESGDLYDTWKYTNYLVNGTEPEYFWFEESISEAGNYTSNVWIQWCNGGEQCVWDLREYTNPVTIEFQTEYEEIRYFINDFPDNGTLDTDIDYSVYYELGPLRSWESENQGVSRFGNDWTTIGTWTSEDLTDNLSITGMQFSMWWVEDPDDDDYDADFQMRWTVESDGEVLVVADYGEEDYNFECEQDRYDPCLWILRYNFDDRLNQGANISVTIEYKSWQDVFVYYGKFFNSGILLECEGGCYDAPVAFIDSISAQQAEQGDSVDFNGSAIVNYGEITDYLWESSIDGPLSNFSSFNTSNLSLGNHTIYFSVNTTNGVSEIVNATIWIYATPVATAGIDVTGYPSVPIQFSGVGSDEDGTVVLYEWDFDGDGVFEWNSGDNGVEIYIYNIEGIYNATLRVTDNDGFTGTDVVRVTIIVVNVTIDDEGNVNVTDDDGEPVPSLSTIFAVVLVSLVALFRRS
ncbi:MAG: hypothetical protein CL398_04895 [Acidiferrobacteraceae bacterium]|nr:hypothetical protein [Acidiferrobacteraceae bacterium]